MFEESTHAIEYHLSRIAKELAEDASKSAKEFPSSEVALRHYVVNGIPLHGSDKEIAQALRYMMQTSMRTLLMMQRRTGDFSL